MTNLKKIHFLIAFLLTINGYAQNLNPVATIPFKLQGDHIFIKLTIGDSEQLDFMFDTGASATVIDTETATRLNFASSNTSTTSGASGETQSPIIENKLISIESIKLDNIDLLGIPLSHLEDSKDENIDGIIGYDLLKKYVIEINHDRSELMFYESQSYEYRGSGEVVKIKGNLPMATFKIVLKEGPYVKERFILDTGANLTIGFTTPFSERSQIKNKIGKTFLDSSRGLSTNIAQVAVGRIKNLKILDFEFENIPVNIYDTKVGFFASKKVAGIVGNEILKRFNITFDYKRNRSYWIKNKKYTDEPFYVQNSGLKLSLDADKSKVVISYIIPNSSAAESELKIGDEIVEIDGVKAINSSLEDIRRLLITQSGKTIKIVYRQADETKELLLDLKPLI